MEYIRLLIIPFEIKNVNRINGFKGVKQLSLAIILMYDNQDYELLLLIQKVFMHLSGSAKKGGGLSGIGLTSMGRFPVRECGSNGLSLIAQPGVRNFS